MNLITFTVSYTFLLHLSPPLFYILHHDISPPTSCCVIPPSPCSALPTCPLYPLSSLDLPSSSFPWQHLVPARYLSSSGCIYLLATHEVTSRCHQLVTKCQWKVNTTLSLFVYQPYLPEMFPVLASPSNNFSQLFSYVSFPLCNYYFKLVSREHITTRVKFLLFWYSDHTLSFNPEVYGTLWSSERLPTLCHWFRNICESENENACMSETEWEKVCWCGPRPTIK